MSLCPLCSMRACWAKDLGKRRGLHYRILNINVPSPKLFSTVSHWFSVVLMKIKIPQKAERSLNYPKEISLDSGDIPVMYLKGLP